MACSLHITDFDLATTLTCGQAFRWQQASDGWWTGVVGRQFWRVRQNGTTLIGDFDPRYFSLDRSLRDIVATFPPLPALQDAVRRYWGLRLLRQEPWETLASFIASSAKQIIQIRQIVELLARRWGEPVVPNAFAFPDPATLARASLSDLLACKLGFRAKYLQAAARAVAAGSIDLASLARLELPRAREELLQLPGVGDKIANCTLLFGCGHDAAFPVDVWMKRVLRRAKGLRNFGPYAGWAQQYLFHAARTGQQSVA